MRLLLASILLSSAAEAFVVPAEMNVVVDKLVNVLPPIGETNPLELAEKTALVPLILYAPFYATRKVLAPEVDEIDFDAPIERQLKVDHIVRRQPFTFGLGDMGTLTLPSTIQNAMHLYEPENKFELPVKDFDEHYFTLVHDECYLGKDLSSGKCVDFDPMH